MPRKKKEASTTANEIKSSIEEIKQEKSDFVDLKDVSKTTPNASIVVLENDNIKKLSDITIFDTLEDADVCGTDRIPDEDIRLIGATDFVDNPNTIDILTWKPKPEEIFFTEKDEMIVASYVYDYFNIPEDRVIPKYVIAKRHYKERIPDLLQHINYFVSHYDPDHEYLLSTLSVKSYIDQHIDMSQKAFRKLLIKRVITPTLVGKLKHMAKDLYKLNINTDKEGKYKSTPKITNEHARMIVAVSFCIRLVLPICIHFSNTNSTFINKRDYIDCFDRIFMDIIDRFEKDDIEIFNPICKFVKYRVDRAHTSDLIIWEKKKQLYGTTLELYLNSLIHEVILVKSLHKLAYNRSIVSFIDGIITHSYNHYKYENFKYKPVEIESDDDGDSDDYLSHAETLEMSIYRVDESNQIINEVNTAWVIEDIRKRFNFDISNEEFEFYVNNVVINRLSQQLMHAFYSRFFRDTNAVRTLNRRDAIELLIYMKKYLQLRGMVFLPQICTAKVHGRFKDNCIKNSRFIEKFSTSSVYQSIIAEKYRYIQELNPKEDPIIKKLSTIINSSFEFVDMDPNLNGYVCNDVNMDIVMDEYMLLLSIC